MSGYYYDENKKKYYYGEHPSSRSLVSHAMTDMTSPSDSYQTPYSFSPQNSFTFDTPDVKISDPSGSNKEGDKESATGKGLEGGMQSLAKGNSVEDSLGAGLMASGEPIAMGAGMGLLALSSVNKAKQARAESRYLAEIRKQQARQEAINKMAQIGQNLKA